MATFLVTADISIFDAESGHCDKRKLSIALPIRDRLSTTMSLRKQLGSLSIAALNDPSQHLRTPITVLGLPVLKYQGVDCVPDASNEYYRPVCSSMGCLTASIKAEYVHGHGRTGTIQIYVRGLTGQRHMVACTPSMMVEHLKARIEDAGGVPAGMQCLIYNGRMLLDSNTLSQHNIGNGTTIHMSARLLGGRGSSLGMRFVDISNPLGLTHIPWSVSAPDWRRASPGLCIEGTCKNPDCKAYDMMVIYNAGFTHFDLAWEVGSKRCKCPMCMEPFVPATCAFNRCEWKYDGVKVSNNTSRPTEVRSQGWRAVGDHYERFSHAEHNQVTWLRLMLVVRENYAFAKKQHKTSSGGSSTTSAPEECCICCDEIASRYGSDVVQTTCGHCFHKSCLKPWMQLGNVSCPLCMSDIRRLAQCL